VDETLHALAGRELVVRLERRPGQKEERWEHRLGEPASAASEAPGDPLEQRVRALEDQVTELREQLDRLL
jgi:uncharacterized protein YceH (UPF0502 family)